MPSKPDRRRFFARILAASGAFLLTGCDRLSQRKWFSQLLAQGEKLSAGAQHLVTSRTSMAQEFRVADLSPEFRSNGTANPNNPHYQALAATSFVVWTTGCRSPAWSSTLVRFHWPNCAPWPVARRSRATIVWKDGAPSANGRGRH